MKQITTNHNVIKKWAQKYKARPGVITGPQDEIIGIRLDFPGTKDEFFFSDNKRPIRINWNEFFAIFEKNNLAFEYDDKEYSKDPTLAYHFIQRDIVYNEMFS